ncbi:hypothetical protein AXG93_745s1080 [Marchantia polymorpha subsp. ruderalis]|uniref:Uncharacterized protein n=1 Tax=Marchantia polymorpha subsp. ruderalis TaxID=1480154 RepID=A0A176VTT7_MARPO|nr:hypothetical protein AXG93_745s1080 [Marchantia polymorpha subsp. ruderalis]
MPSAEARQPSGQERQRAAPTNVPAADRCSAQVPFADSPSGLEPSAQRRKWKEPADKAPSAQGPSAQGTSGEPPSAKAQSEKQDDGEKGKTRVPSAQLPWLKRLRRWTPSALRLWRTRTKVRTSKLLASLDEYIKDLRLKNKALRGHITLSRKLQKAINKTRDDKFEEAKKEFAKEQAKPADELDSEQT